MQGWIKLHRKIQSHWLYQEKRKFSRYEAWLDLLMKANHEDSKIVLGNEIIEVKRGQRITSIRQLGDKWLWSNTKVIQFLKLLQDDGMIVVKSDTKKTLITIVNYDFFQNQENEKTTENRHKNDTKQTEKHTNKNEKNEKNDKEDIKPLSRKLKTYDTDSVYFQLALRLLNNIKNNNPAFKEPNLQKWADDIRLMIDCDQRTKEQIEYLIDWCQQDSFWKANILSPAKLRKQFDRLVIQVKEKKSKNGHVIPMERPIHFKKPKPITTEDLNRLKRLEEEMPY